MAHTKTPLSTAGSIPAFANTNTCIVLDDTGTLFRVRVYTSQGDITTLGNVPATFTDEDIAAGKLKAYLKMLVPGLV